MDKIGYTYDEILEFMTKGEGRGFLGRSMYDAIRETIEEKDKEIEKLTNAINELEKELDNLIIFNQSNITCNHYTPDDWKDSKLIGNMLYKMKPVSFLAQELKDKLKVLKEGK